MPLGNGKQPRGPGWVKTTALGYAALSVELTAQQLLHALLQAKPIVT
jgi:hypothetical protein